MPDLNDPEFKAWENGYRRKPSLKIRIEPFTDRDAHAARLVAMQMRQQRNYGLPLIPAVETAHYRQYCDSCGVRVVWAPQGQPPKCPECRLIELSEAAQTTVQF